MEKRENEQILDRYQKKKILPILESRPTMHCWSAEWRTSDKVDTTGRHNVCTLILLSPIYILN